MTTSWTSYPKIFAFGHRAVRDLFTQGVIIEEKIDGSQFSFGIFDGEIRVKSKQVEFPVDAPAPMFREACETVKARAHLLHPGWTYRGEYLQKPKHNTLAYDRIPEGHIIIFDVNDGHESYLDVYSKMVEANRIGLESVDTFGYLAPGEVNLGLLERFLDAESALGGVKIEGIVVKSLSLYGDDKKLLMAKHVSEAFKEKHQGDWKGRNPNRADIVTLLVERYRHENRWEKAVQRLRDAGQLEYSPRDIGALVREAQADIDAECADEIKDALYRHFKDKILRGSIGGLPEWYKGKLLEKQFEEVTE